MSSAVAVMALIALGLLAAEIAFRIWYRNRHGHDYFVALKFKWDEGHVVPHPFLTFAYRKNGVIARNQRLPYALCPGKYWSFKEPLKLNDIGHFGPSLSVERAPDVLRVACLGSSGTANNIADESRDYSYPELLRQYLQEHPTVRSRYRAVEVMNCGIGGWTTIDVLIDFEINVLHYRPQYVLFYQGLNDLPLHLMEEYCFDYSHGRANLGEVIHRIKLAYWFPKLPWWRSYEYTRDKLLGTGNVRNDVLRRVEIGEPDYARPYRPLVAEEMAMHNLALLCIGHRIPMIVGSYAFYLHNDSVRNRKLREGVELENALYRRIAEKYGFRFVDLDMLIPKDEKHFVDAVHFTPLGIEAVSRHFGRALAEELASRDKAPTE